MSGGKAGDESPPKMRSVSRHRKVWITTPSYRDRILASSVSIGVTRQYRRRRDENGGSEDTTVPDALTGHRSASIGDSAPRAGRRLIGGRAWRAGAGTAFAAVPALYAP